MARAVSLASIETQVRQRAQMENSTFITSAEMLSYINASGCELYELLVAARGKEYYLSSQTIVTTSGVSGYALATNFYEVVGIDLAVGGRSVTLQRYEFAERNRFQNPVVVPAFTPLVYGIEGTTLRLLPTPTSAQTVTVWYVPAPTLYTTTDSTFDGIAGCGFAGGQHHGNTIAHVAGLAGGDGVVGRVLHVGGDRPCAGHRAGPQGHQVGAGVHRPDTRQCTCPIRSN